MLRIYAILICTLALASCSTSDKDWLRIKNQLSDIGQKDQQYRVAMDSIAKVAGWRSKAVEELWLKQRALDSANLAGIDQVIDEVGYPSREKVGDLADVPFMVIQRASDSTMASYYHVIVGAALSGDLRMKDVATYQDKVLMMRRQPQEFGTQVWIEFKQNPVTGEKYDSMFVWAIRDSETINERRLSIGLDSLETHVRRYGIDPAVGYLIKESSRN